MIPVVKKEFEINVIHEHVYGVWFLGGTRLKNFLFLFYDKISRGALWISVLTFFWLCRHACQTVKSYMYKKVETWIVYFSIRTDVKLFTEFMVLILKISSWNCFFFFQIQTDFS